MRRSRWVAAPLTTMVVTAVALGGCAKEKDESPQEQAPQQGYAQVPATTVDGADPNAGALEKQDAENQGDPRRDPQWVMTQAGQVLFTWYPVTDTNRGDATVRAAEFLAPELVHDTPSITPGQQWQQWREEGAVINAKARVLDEAHPPDTDTTMWRVVEVVQSKTTGAGVQRIEPSTTVWMVCERRPDGTWTVNDYRLM